MSEEVLQQNDTLPVIDREKLGNEAQNRELDRLFSSLESDRFSLQDVQQLLMQIGQNVRKTRPYITEFIAGRNQQIKQVLIDNKPPEIKENPETTKKLNMYQTLIIDIQKSLKDIQNSLNNSTSLSLKVMDSTVGLFSDDTVFNTYNSSFESTKSQAKDILGKVKEVDINSLSSNQKEIYNKLITDLQNILTSELEPTGIIQMGVNEIKNRPQDLKNAVYGVSGESVGVKDGLVGIAKGSIEFAKFLAQYPFSEKYRNEISEQFGKISDFWDKNGVSGSSSKLYEVLKNEMENISKLPQEKQAQAIGKIAGNVISAVIAIKGAIAVGSKLKKVSQAESIISKAEASGNMARVESVKELTQTLLKGKMGFHAIDILLTGVAESALMKGLSMSYKGLLASFKGQLLSQVEKVKLIDNAINDAKGLSPKNKEEQELVDFYIQELNREKQKSTLVVKDMSVEEIKGLKNNSDRLEVARQLLGLDTLSEIQKQAILKAHEIGTLNKDGKFEIGDLRKKYIILQEAGLEDSQIRTLMEKGVCGKEKLPNIDSLYSHPKYSFLEKYKDVLGEDLSINDIVGEGTQAIIVRHPTNEKLVVKIARPGEVDDIMQEFHNHNLFYEKVKELKRQGLINNQIRVPYVIKGEKDGYFLMEKVNGQSLYSKTLIDKFSHKLTPENLEQIGKLEDKQVREYLKKNFSETDSYLDQIIENYSVDKLMELLGNTYKIRRETGKTGGTLLDVALKILRDNGVAHNDLHPGNIMIDRNGNIYIIDFGRIKEFNK